MNRTCDQTFQGAPGAEETQDEAPDILIACITLAQDALLVTRNTKDFNNVSGLNLANWAEE